MPLRNAAFAVALLLLAGPAAADTIYLRGGDTIEGTVLEVGEEAIVLSLRGLSTSRVEVPFARISDYGLFEIKRSRIDRSSASDHERLGDWALDRGLFGFAMSEYRQALDIAGDAASDDLREKLVTASNSCGKDKLERAALVAKEGRLEEARELYRDILKNHPACPAAGEARKRIADFRRRSSAERMAERERRASEKSVKDVTRGLEVAKALILDGQRLRRSGQLLSGNLGRSEDAFLGSIDAYQRASRVLRKVEKMPGAREQRQAIAALSKTIVSLLGDVYVDIGHNFVVKGNLVRANHYVGLALAIDPNSPNALALRNVIGVAAASDRFPR